MAAPKDIKDKSQSKLDPVDSEWGESPQDHFGYGSDKERLAIVLRDLEGMSTREVAHLLGNRPATVRVQVSSARGKIRRFLEGRRQGDPS